MKRINTAVLAVLAVCLGLQAIVVIPALSQPFSFDVIVGEWARTDGNVSIQEGLIKLFVKLKDKGYPGSTYTLYYYAEKDALVGHYYQAAMNRTFKVIFLRKRTM
jgi:hypothetical protein